ncbi:agmatinase [Erwinia toletana]|uniref:Agmatinase n=1 Tax=Winslowiella toletana TaxID=92490 RepID=A0ABS4PBJ6_9GAMM|nr:arginase family protein [Winslowiella toletana]MBP2170012.1 agmatinase [Winslowiella toletana]
MTNMRGVDRVNRAFSGISTFLRANYCEDIAQLQAEMAIFGVPFDEASPFMPGTRMAPRSIREHSMRFSPSGFYDIARQQHFLASEITDGKIQDVGDIDILPTNLSQTMENISAMTRQLRRKGVIAVAMGGDHSVSYPLIRGIEEPVHVIQFDAHLDFAPVQHEMHYTNGQPFRHIAALPQVKSLTQVGIRSLRVRPGEIADAQAQGSRIVPVNDFRQCSPQQIAALLPAGEKCYVSIDIDVLDMALVPGCVSAEPDGLSYAQLRDTLCALAERMDIIGFDLVEVNPLLDVATGMTSYLAAHTMVEFMGHIFAHR